MEDQHPTPPAVMCPYCGSPAELVTGNVIYPHRRDLISLKFWRCAPCEAWVGCHEAGTYHRDGDQLIAHTGIEPLGRLANADLRRWKSAAHAAFDPLWKKGPAQAFSNRRAAYGWLGHMLGLPPADRHIGMMDVAGCQAVVDACNEKRRQARKAA